MKSSTLLRRLKQNVMLQIVLVWVVLLALPVSMELAG